MVLMCVCLVSLAITSRASALDNRKISSHACGKNGTGATGTWLATHEHVATACDCENLCRKNIQCVAWQWFPAQNIERDIKHDSNGYYAELYEENTCYLKSSSGLAPNRASISAEYVRPPAPSPSPPGPPPSNWSTTATLRSSDKRPVILYGFGNELCYQSLNDTVLASVIASAGGTVGRFPGGTPSDYWHWDTGWATDLSGYQGPRPATPATWATYTKISNTRHTVFDVNQLTANLSYAIAGLRAHEAAGSDVRFVELGNEMYDGSRADVVAAYPNGSVYAQKMSVWTRAIHDAFPKAAVALVGERYNDYSNPREDR